MLFHNVGQVEKTERRICDVIPKNDKKSLIGRVYHGLTQRVNFVLRDWALR